MAETLITLTIIGVVAALTIPTLMNKYTKHTYVVGLKKAYSQLSNAMKMIPITEGCSAGDYDCAGMFQEWGKATNIDGMDFGGNPTKKQAYLFSKQFKINDICYDNCGFTNFGHIEMGNNFPIVKAQDGMLFAFSNSTIGVDINGLKGPNQGGRDVFLFAIAYETRNGIDIGTVMPYGSKISTQYDNDEFYYWKNYNDCNTNRIKSKSDVESCAGRVLEEDAMNY